MFILNYATSVEESGVLATVVLQKSERIAGIVKSHVPVQRETATPNRLAMGNAIGYGG